METYKPWDQLAADEKVERLRHDLHSFIERSDEQHAIRNQAIGALKARLELIEAELRHMATRLGRLER